MSLPSPRSTSHLSLKEGSIGAQLGGDTRLITGSPHRVEADDARQVFEAGAFFCAYFLATLIAGVHVVAVQRVLDRHFVQGLVQVLHVCHLTTNRVKLFHLIQKWKTIHQLRWKRKYQASIKRGVR